MPENIVSDMVIFFLGQSVIILGAIVSSYIKIKSQMASTDAKVDYTMCSVKQLRDDHKSLATRVEGISRHVSRIEGRCVALHSSDFYADD